MCICKKKPSKNHNFQQQQNLPEVLQRLLINYFLSFLYVVHQFLPQPMQDSHQTNYRYDIIPCAIDTHPILCRQGTPQMPHEDYTLAWMGFKNPVLKQGNKRPSTSDPHILLLSPVTTVCGAHRSHYEDREQDLRVSLLL